MVSMILRRKFYQKTKRYGIELIVRKKKRERFLSTPEKVFKEISNSWLSYDDQYKLFVEYMKLLNRTKIPKKCEVARKLLDYLGSICMLCDSEILIQYVYIRRQTKDLESMRSIIKICKDLRIYRCSFKTFAILLTTYAKNAMDASERDIDLNVSNMEECLDYFIGKLKYHPNTYLFNFVLNTYNKLELGYKFWIFYVDVLAKEIKKRFKKENKIVFDLYTWCCLFQRCIAEENPEKFDFIHKSFDPTYFSDKQMGFYKILVRKIDIIRNQQKKNDFERQKFLSDFEKRRSTREIWKPIEVVPHFVCLEAN
jgi:hypothetical protein